jgi:coiled-coil domain-containing protein 55
LVNASEGDEFADKEVFVTGAYRKKMQEMQEAEEEERRQAQIEGSNILLNIL